MAETSNAGPDAAYRAFLAKGEFRLQRFDDVGFVFPPRLVAPGSGSSAYRWDTPSGLGTVYSTTVIRRRAEQGGDYGIVLVDLDEGPRMLGRVDGVAPDAVKIGLRVKASIAEVSGEKAIVFVPAER